MSPINNNLMSLDRDRVRDAVETPWLSLVESCDSKLFTLLYRIPVPYFWDRLYLLRNPLSPLNPHRLDKINKLQGWTCYQVNLESTFQPRCTHKAPPLHPAVARYHVRNLE